jgi:hypothetical protein
VALFGENGTAELINLIGLYCAVSVTLNGFDVPIPGVRFGRPPALTAHQRREAIQRLAEGHAQADVARSYNVSQATISRLEPSPFEGASVAAV